MFHRDYMEYHSDRFVDHSLMFLDGKKLVAMLPGCVDGDTFVSHGGLTFGGLITSSKTTQQSVLDCFSVLLRHANDQDWSRILYKTVPHIFTQQPAEEDLYAIFKHQAGLVRRDVSSAINLKSQVKFRNLNRRAVKKSVAKGVEIGFGELSNYWPILEGVLQAQHGTRPVHTLDEITELANRFPENIQCVCAFLDGVTIAGTVLFLNRGVAHTQYLAANNAARELGALNHVIDWCIDHFNNSDYRWLNFGISTEDAGKTLNDGLLFYKEGFGARSIVFDHYEFLL